MIEIIKCPCCSKKKIIELISLRDDKKKILDYKRYSKIYYNGFLNDFNLDKIILSKCLNCGHVFYKFQPSDEFLFKMYKIREELRNKNEKKNLKKYNKFRNILKKIIKINKGQKILDFGAGTGELSIICEEFNIEYFGFEPGANRNNFIDNKKVFSDLDKLKKLNKTFDIIFINQVLEHLKNPNSVLKDINSFCNKNTIIYVSVPNIDRSKEGKKLLQYWPYDDNFGHHTLAPFQHLHGFNTKSLISLMQNSNFKISSSISTMSQIKFNFLRIFLGMFFKSVSTTDILFVKKSN